LKTLRTRQPFPYRNQLFNGLYSLATVEEYLQNAAALSSAYNKTFGVYIEMKTPSYFSSIGLPMEDKLLSALAASTLYGPSACSSYTDPSTGKWCPVFIQCFESTALINIKGKYPRIQLMGAPNDIQDDTGRPYSEMMTSKGLAAVAKYSVGIGPDKSTLLAPASTLLRDAHDHQLLVHPYTFRENTQQTDPQLDVLRSQLEQFYRMGVDGVFTDLPDVALEVRHSVYSPEPTGLNWRLPMVCFFLGFLLALGVVTGFVEFAKVKLYSVTVNPTNNNDDSPTASSSSSSSSSSSMGRKREEERGLIAAEEV